MSTLSLEDFKKHPTVEKLTAGELKKTDWIKVAKAYGVQFKHRWRKAKVKNASSRDTG